MSAAGAWLATDHLAEQFTAIVQGVAEGNAPSRMLARFRPSTPFAVTERGGQTVIDPRSFARFDGIADTVTSLDAAASARAYRTLAPRLNEAYAQLGITDSTLDAALEHAIIRLVKTPCRTATSKSYLVEAATRSRTPTSRRCRRRRSCC